MFTYKINYNFDERFVDEICQLLGIEMPNEFRGGINTTIELEAGLRTILAAKKLSKKVQPIMPAIRQIQQFFSENREELLELATNVATSVSCRMHGHVGSTEFDESCCLGD